MTSSIPTGSPSSTTSGSTRSAGSASTTTSRSLPTIGVARWCGGARARARRPPTPSSKSSTPSPSLPPPPAPGRPASQPREAQEPAIMVPFGPCPTVPAGHGIPAAWLHRRPRARPGGRGARLQADRRLDGHDRRLRQIRPPPRPAGRPSASTPTTSSSSPTRRWTRSAEPTGTRCAPSATSDAAKRFKDARWCLLKRPENLTDQQAATLARLKTAGGEVWRAYTLKEAVRGIFEAGLSLEDVTILIDRLLSPAWPAAGLSRSSASAKRSANTATGSSPRSASGSTKAAPRRSTTRSGSSPAARTGFTPPRPRSRSSCSPAAPSPFTSHTSYTRSGSGDTDHIHAKRAG